MQTQIWRNVIKEHKRRILFWLWGYYNQKRILCLCSFITVFCSFSAVILSGAPAQGASADRKCSHSSDLHDPDSAVHNVSSSLRQRLTDYWKIELMRPLNLTFTLSPNKTNSTTVSLWTWAKLRSWSWTSGRDSSSPTLLLWSVGPLWRGWAAASTSV